MKIYLSVLLVLISGISAFGQEQGKRIRLQEISSEKNYCLDSSKQLVESCGLGTMGFDVKVYANEKIDDCTVRLIGRVITSNTRPRIGVPRISIYAAKLKDRQLLDMTLLSESSYDPKILDNLGFFDFNIDCKEQILMFVGNGYFVRLFRIMR